MSLEGACREINWPVVPPLSIVEVVNVVPPSEDEANLRIAVVTMIELDRRLDF